jgi:hypothetical protein
VGPPGDMILLFIVFMRLGLASPPAAVLLELLDVVVVPTATFNK